MKIKEIIEKYLPILQDLQTKVAACGNQNLEMNVYVSHTCLRADILLNREDGTGLEKWCNEFLFDYLPDEWLDRSVCELNAFFAECNMTTPTGVNYPICQN